MQKCFRLIRPATPRIPRWTKAEDGKIRRGAVAGTLVVEGPSFSLDLLYLYAY